MMLTCYRTSINYINLLYDVVVDNSSRGELLSLSQCMFCLFSIGDFKHYDVAALTYIDMHHYVVPVDERGKLQSEQGGFMMSRIRVGWIRGLSRVNLIPE